MSDELRETRGRAGEGSPGDAAPPPAREPVSELFLGKAEFHQEMGYLKGAIRHEATDLRGFAGWVLASTGVWALTLGYLILRDKGERP